MIATNGEKLEHLRVTQGGTGCVQIDLSNRSIFKHNKHYNAYLINNADASSLARRLLQATWTPYRINGVVNAPKKSGLYLVSMKYRENPNPITYILYYEVSDRYWINSYGDDFEEECDAEVFAWHELPAPYGETEEKTK